MRRTLTTAASDAVRLRFAPSPTGALHAGGARTALFNYLFARKCELRGCDATFLVRIDDSDSSRTVPGAEEAILSDLAWLGMRFGAPARCSDRDYASTVDQLLETGHAYRDFGGDTNWRDASDAEVRPRLADEAPHAVRFRVPRPDHPVTHVVEDAVRDLRWADVRRTLREDFVLVRRDGAPLYALCAVCGLCGIQAPAPSPRLLDGVFKRAAPSTRAPARRRETSRRAGRRRRARRHHARRPRGGARVERAAPDAAARRARRAAAALRALLARRRPGCVPRRPRSHAIDATLAWGRDPRAQTAGSSRSGPRRWRPSPLYETTAARRSA